ncbi:MAG: DUF2304 domain-containing protein [bacterium]
MVLKIQIFAAVAGGLLLLFVLELIRRRRFREEYSILWLLSAIVLIIFSLWRNLLEMVAKWMGIDYAPAVLLPLIVFLGVAIFLHFSVVITKLSDQNKALAQELALLKERMKEIGSRATEKRDE